MSPLSFWLGTTPVFVFLLLGIALAIAGIRLLWIAGSYLKRKRQLLDSRP